MVWLQNNWIWLAVAVGFVAMHFFGHGGHRHGREDRVPETSDTNGTKIADASGQDGAQAHAGHGAAPATSPSKQHRHGC